MSDTLRRAALKDTVLLAVVVLSARSKSRTRRNLLRDISALALPHPPHVAVLNLPQGPVFHLKSTRGGRHELPAVRYNQESDTGRVDLTKEVQDLFLRTVIEVASGLIG